MPGRHDDPHGSQGCTPSRNSPRSFSAHEDRMQDSEAPLPEHYSHALAVAPAPMTSSPSSAR